MVDKQKNKQINDLLRKEYELATDEFLIEWQKAFPKDKPPFRINEFGIIDEDRYDAENGVLFICRETNKWRDEEFEAGCLFRGWMESITKEGLEGRGHIKEHPNMWYNIGRWITLIDNPDMPTEEIAEMKTSAISAIGKIAFTNVNKVRGKEKSGDGYYQLAHSEITGSLLKKEIDIINPQMIVCCGTCRPVVNLIPEYKGKLILMPHPAARKSKIAMLDDLKSQLRR